MRRKRTAVKSSTYKLGGESDVISAQGEKISYFGSRLCGRLSFLGIDLSRDQILDRDPSAISDGRGSLPDRRFDPVRRFAARSGPWAANSSALDDEGGSGDATAARRQRRGCARSAVHFIRTCGIARCHRTALDRRSKLGLAAFGPS